MSLYRNKINRMVTAVLENSSSFAFIEDNLFFTYINPNHNRDIQSAIKDSGFCCQVVGQETLNLAMAKLGLSELKNENRCQKRHSFGPFNYPIKIICFVGVPFVCNILLDKNSVLFHVRLNVIEEYLPFLISLPFLLAM